MDQIPHWWHLVICGWEAGGGAITWKGSKGHRKMEQNPSAALGFPLNICLLQGSSKQHGMAWSKWLLPEQTYCCQGTRTSPVPHPQGHSQGAGICWLIFASWCCRSVAKLAGPLQITFSCLAVPELGGRKTQFGRTYCFWSGAAGRPGHCSAESSSRKCGCMWKQADLKQYSLQGITQIILQWQWSYLLSWQYEESISFYLLMVVSGFISLTASVATCCFPWCFSLVVFFQLSL